MTEQQWRYHTPERDGHAPDDWVEGMECMFKLVLSHTKKEIWGQASYFHPSWRKGTEYRYRPLQDAAYEPDLLAQCLALPQDKREALIEAMQKPQRDWAGLVVAEIADILINVSSGKATGQAEEYLRSMCRPREELQHVAYYNDGEFYWMSGIAPRDCELFAKRKDCA